MTAQAYPRIRQFIGGHWVDGTGDATEDVLNPATGGVLTRFVHASPTDIEAADCAALPWRNTSPEARYRILRRGAQLLRELADATACNLSLEQANRWLKPRQRSRHRRT